MAKLRGRIMKMSQTVSGQSQSGHAYQMKNFIIAVQKLNSETGQMEIDENNTPMLTVFGRTCEYLSKIPVGDMIEVNYEIEGSRYRDEHGEVKIRTRISVKRIEHLKPQNPWRDINC